MADADDPLGLLKNPSVYECRCGCQTWLLLTCGDVVCASCKTTSSPLKIVLLSGRDEFLQDIRNNKSN